MICLHPRSGRPAPEKREDSAVGRPGETLILGIETSCDETAAAVVADGHRILSNLVSSQVDLHRRYGGVVPEIASRQHLELINPLIEDALAQAKVGGLQDLDAVAVCPGPGLVGALLVGVATAKALAYASRLPLIAVHHLEGHLHANFLTGAAVPYPLVGLIASGGHTALVYLRREGEKLALLGQTRDDAAGEAFDKIARLAGLGYPGGPAIEKEATMGNPAAYHFPRAYLDRESRHEFSFSGLKSAVINFLEQSRRRGEDVPLSDLAASFQAAVVEVLAEKTVSAAVERNAACVLLAGGVAANRALRALVRRRLTEEAPGLPLFCPPPELCTDNAAMIAAAAYPRLLQGQVAPLDLNATPDLPLGSL